ncbi:hypothetical protein FUSO6_04795 [Fusobacterium necrophorum DAB]|uniref:dCTP deaminase domain-containing protein n=1 Tax=Fusobacterium necrophorum TaxID=859 RepID=UPI00046108D8|nr:hypothetical protein [Fusobacterium necrophorum]KDE70300.1 hypothetical protein FUSO6_04795 [Fusobacterium necrophorum DAB]
MKLNGHEIEKLQESLDNFLISPFDIGHLGVVSYDLSIDSFYQGGKKVEKDSIQLQPEEIIFVGVTEIINLPLDIIGIVTEKNSRIRQGLEIVAPVYQPGHHTRIFLRIKNISSDEITLSKKDKIAQIMFERINIVEKGYEGAFTDEFSFMGLSHYDSEYKSRKVEKKYSDLKDLESKIYTVIIVLMGVFTAIVSFVMTLFSRSIHGFDILLVTISTITMIAALFGISSMFVFTNKRMQTYLSFLIAFLGIFFIFYFSNHFYISL